MAKYIDADKLIAEIERQRRENLGSPECVCDDILSLIASLQQEQHEVDLENEIDMEWSAELLSRKEFAEIASHFYELGLNTRKEESK